MTQNWKTIIGLGTAVAILLGIIYIKTGPKTQTSSNSLQPTPPSAASRSITPQATDNADDMQSALLQSATQEQSTFNDEAGDSSAVSDDNQAIENFGQAYDANAF